MTDVIISKQPPKRRRFFRILGWVAAVLVVLIVAVYFTVTSSAFLKKAILPRVSKALNADVTVSDAAIHPFSSVTLRNLKVQPKGRETLLTAPEVRVRYSLFAILGGNIAVEELAIASPTIHLVEQPDGSSNLDPLTQATEAKPKEGKPKGESKPPKIDIKKLSLSNATIRNEKLYAGGKSDVAEVSNLNVTLSNLKNGDSGKLTMNGNISVQNNPPAPDPAGTLQAALIGEYNFALSPELKPQSVKGQAQLTVSRAEGAFSDLSSLSAVLASDVSPTEIVQLALRFQKGGAALGELRASGPFDMTKMEGRVRVEVLPLDKRVLNLAGAASGIDFGTTLISSTNEIQLANSGKLISASGRFDATKLQIIQTNQTTPTLDIRANYDVSLDLAASNAVLRAFTLNGTQNGNPLLRGDLASPMPLSWGGASSAVGDSSLRLVVTNLNLSDWKAFTRDTASGIAGLTANLASRQGGKQLGYDLAGQLSNLSASVGTNRISGATVRLQVRGEAADLKQFNLRECLVELARQGRTVLTLAGSGTYNTTNQAADMNVTVGGSLPSIADLLAQPGISITAGSMSLNAHLVQRDQTQTITGNFAVSNLTARVGENNFQNFRLGADLDVNKSSDVVQIRKLAGTLGQNGRPGGTFDVSGTYGLSNSIAKFTAKLADFNQDGLRPFLETMLAGKKLASVAVNGSASADYDPAANSAITADLQMTNLVVSDPQQPGSAAPLEAHLQLDTALEKQVIDVRQFQVTLTPTQLAKNQLQLTGRVDRTDTNAIQGNLKITAESLDLTRYYDLFAGEGKTPEAAKPASGPATSSSSPAATTQPEKEPEAQTLHFRNFVAEVNIGRVYLRELEITNLLTTVKLDANRVQLQPFQLAINGAPVTASADVDVSVPGYKYALSFDATHVPFAPLVNTFQPSRKGELGGTLSAHAKINGAGTTGASLQKSLAGNFDVGTTNLNLSAANIRSPMLKLLVSVIAMVPQLAQNPEGALGSLVSGLTGSVTKGLAGGMSGDITNSPIDVISARGVAGNGKVELQQATVRSTVFEADAAGTITLAAVLTNSTLELPISISLVRPLAERIKMVPPNTPTNETYVKLPDFFAETGTLGNPKARIDKLALGKAVFKELGNFIPGSGGGTNSSGVGGLIQGIGGMLGNRGATNAPAAPNQPATNQTPAGNILNRLLGPGTK